MLGAVLLAEVLDDRLMTATTFCIELVDEVRVRLS